MILERRLVQVGSGARTVGKRLGRRDEGFAGFGVPLVSHGAVGGEAAGVHGAPPPHPEFGVSASQAVRGVCVCVCVCVCVWVWVGSHTNCTGVVGCAWSQVMPRRKSRIPTLKCEGEC